jgi:hypothetical protein
MALRIKAVVCLALVGGGSSLCAFFVHPAQHSLHSFVYLAAILLSSGMKVGLPRSVGTMSLTFPSILSGIRQLSPLQAVCLAGCGVIAQCRIRVIRSSTLVLQAMEPGLSFALLKAFRLSSTKRSTGFEPALESLAAQ